MGEDSIFWNLVFLANCMIKEICGIAHFPSLYRITFLQLFVRSRH